MEKLREEFEQIVGELEWQDVAATLQELCSNVMSDPTPTTSPHLPSQNPSSNPNLSPVFGLSLDVRPQPARLPARLPFIPPAQLVALPSMRYGPQFNPYIMQPFYLSRQPGGPFRHQFLPCQVPAHVVQSQGAFTFTSAPAQQKKNLPVVPLPEGATLRAVGMLNGEVLYAAVDASQAAPPPLPAASFTEQRLAMKSQLENMDSAAVNKLLAQLWTSLNKEQQAKYYEQAFVEKKLHEQMSSEASSGDQDKSQEKSQGPKNKRQRVSTTAQHNANAWNAADDGLSSSSPASPSSSSSPSPSSSSSTTSSVSSASSSSLSSLADATAEGGDTAVSPSAMPRPPDKCPNSGDESDIDGMDAQLLHLLGCC
ncbi:uncharacterized protein LOC130905276 isoform X2 [Corythoichthys intestinalis]|uniref:uncharacterized protein LOC130905276 isoform X2 n=1 Tax=Corythoichthys intestinalis TaxID=161448 RepID=UPI0025A4D5A8|nr:uncharacterized protein LOC130905276 isoform X2 [Corythoichthys intestinalis]